MTTATITTVHELIDLAVSKAYDEASHTEDVDAFIDDLGDFPAREIDQWFYLEEVEGYESPEYV